MKSIINEYIFPSIFSGLLRANGGKMLFSPLVKKICILFIVFCTHIIIFSQGWFPLTANTINWHHSIYFINSSTGYLSGELGKIFKTTDGGNSWTPKQTFTSLGIYTIFFLKNSEQLTGYAGGEYGTMIKTIDGGESWSFLNSTLDSAVLSIYFVNSVTGYASSDLGRIIKTKDRGSSWVLLNTGVGNIIHTLFFINSELGYAAGSTGLFLKTTNGGETWLNQTTSHNYYIRSLYFINETTGFASGGRSREGGKIFKTTNGGENWIFHDPGTFNHLLSICFTNPNTGYASGFAGTIVKTTNAGSTWFLLQSGTINTLRSICFTGTDTGYAAGSFGTIIKTTTAGEPIGIKLINSRVPERFYLNQNYPNPFNPVTMIRFSLPSAKGEGNDASTGRQRVRLIIYDILGIEAASLIPPLLGGKEGLSPGTYEIVFNAGDLPSGVYFYRLTAGTYSDTKKMMLIK